MEAEEKILFELAGKDIAEEVVAVSKDVYFFRGYGVSNATLVIGEKNCILIDAFDNDEVAKRAKKEIEKITDKPVKSIIYTHTHQDHTAGAGVFVDDKAEIYASEAKQSIYGHSELLRDVTIKRTIMQFGSLLTAQESLSTGLAPCSKISGKDLTIPPNIFIKNEIEEKQIDGVLFRFYKAVGETDDQMYVYLPEQNILCCGDNYYRSWPNLSAPRGSQYRDISSWVNSLKLILDIQPEYLISGHSEMIVGKEKIVEEITPYKEAIEYVLVETLKAMNEGLSIEEVAEKVVLPQKYRLLPQLQELYGMVDWAVRGIYSGYLGWFDGNPTNLHFLPPKQKAEKRIALAGGSENILKEINKSLEQKDYQWVLELCDDLLNAQKEVRLAKEAKAKALEALAHKQTSANGRHIYFTAAKLLKKELGI